MKKLKEIARELGYKPKEPDEYFNEYWEGCPPDLKMKVNFMDENQKAAFFQGVYSSYLHCWFTDFMKNPPADAHAIYMAQMGKGDAQA
jgi:hypothetical protein